MAGHNGKETTAEAAEGTARDVGRELRDRADGFRLDIVKQLHNFAQTIRKEVQSVDDIDSESVERAERFASGLDSAADYLNRHTVEDLGGEATAVVQRNPWKVLGFAFVVGVIIGLLLRGSD